MIQADENKVFFRFESTAFNHLENAFEQFHFQFKQTLQSRIKVHLLFLFLILIELGLFGYLIQSEKSGYLIGISLALIFFTLFTWAFTRLYLQDRKRTAYHEILQNFLANAKAFLSYKTGIPEHHIAIANGCCRLAGSLKGWESTMYPKCFSLPLIGEPFEAFCRFLHWPDLFQMREKLLLETINEHTKLVQCEPTNLEVHTALANSYINLSSLYACVPQKQLENEQFKQLIQERFHNAASKAIEEFKILKAYATDDPWIHMQLAYSYHDLGMPEEEIHEYETILSLKPGDRDVLFKLGKLYFEKGRNAEGLQIYEELKPTDPNLSQKLIQHYGKITA